MFSRNELEKALRDCHARMSEGESLEDCLQLYPEFASEIEAHFGLLRDLTGAKVKNPPALAARNGRRMVLSAVAAGPVKEKPMFASPIAKVGAGLVAGFVLGSMTLGAGAATETVNVGGPVGDFLTNVGVQGGPLQTQEEDEEEEEEEEELEEEELEDADEGPGGPVTVQQGEGYGHDHCFPATETARQVLSDLLAGIGPFGNWEDLPDQAQPGLTEEGEAGVAASLVEIENCGMGADEAEGQGGPPEGVGQGGPPEGVGQGGPPEGVGQGGPPEGVGQGGPPEGVGQGGPPDGIGQGGPPTNIPGLGGQD